MSSIIDFEKINIKKDSQQDEHKFYFYVKKNSKKISIETDFIYQKESGIKIKNDTSNYKTYSNPYDKITDLIVILDNEQEACENLKKSLAYYDNELKLSVEHILDKFSTLYIVQDSVYISKSEEEYCVFNLDIGWNYYLKKTGQVLDVPNSQIVKSKTIKFYSENKDKSKEEKKELIKSLEFELNFIENNKSVNKKVLMSEIINKKDKINTEIYVRKQQISSPDIKKPNECNEDEILKFYGKPQKIDVQTMSQLTKIYKNNSYVKFHCEIINGYANKNVMNEDNKKRKLGLNYTIKAIEIINLNIDEDKTNGIDNDTNEIDDDNGFNGFNDNTSKKTPVYLFGRKK